MFSAPPEQIFRSPGDYHLGNPQTNVMGRQSLLFKKMDKHDELKEVIRVYREQHPPGDGDEYLSTAEFVEVGKQVGIYASSGYTMIETIKWLSPRLTKEFGNAVNIKNVGPIKIIRGWIKSGLEPHYPGAFDGTGTPANIRNGASRCSKILKKLLDEWCTTKVKSQRYHTTIASLAEHKILQRQAR
jgi:hypothetical protein